MEKRIGWGMERKSTAPTKGEGGAASRRRAVLESFGGLAQSAVSMSGSFQLWQRNTARGEKLEEAGRCRWPEGHRELWGEEVTRVVSERREKQRKSTQKSARLI